MDLEGMYDIASYHFVVDVWLSEALIFLYNAPTSREDFCDTCTWPPHVLFLEKEASVFGSLVLPLLA